MRDVVRGTLAFLLEKLRARVALAGPRDTLAETINTVCNRRAFEQWLREPIEDPPGVAIGDEG